MYIKLKPPLQLSAIPRIPFDAAANRSQFRIAIVDNDRFEHTEELRKHGYQITELGDIHDFRAVADYPVVACDIKDVGSHFGGAFQGAHVLGEIRRLYPSKFLIAYSSGVFGAAYKKYWDMCDVFLRRDGGFDQWIETLDKGVMALGDPVRYWLRVRKLLLDSDVSAFEVYLLEQGYIKSILSKESYYISKAMEKVKKFSAAGELVDNLAAGLVVAIKFYVHLKA